MSFVALWLFLYRQIRFAAVIQVYVAIGCQRSASFVNHWGFVPSWQTGTGIWFLPACFTRRTPRSRKERNTLLHKHFAGFASFRALRVISNIDMPPRFLKQAQLYFLMPFRICSGSNKTTSSAFSSSSGGVCRFSYDRITITGISCSFASSTSLSIHSWNSL